ARWATPCSARPRTAFSSCATIWKTASPCSWAGAGRRRPSSTANSRPAGRRAEPLVFDGDLSTGAADDLQRATEIAMQMVTRYGMNETLGPRTYAPPPQPFLTGQQTGQIEASQATEREIDLAVRDIAVKAFERATDVLRRRRADLDEGARRLLEH